MIHLNVWFSFEDLAADDSGLQRVRAFLDQLQSRGKLESCTILKSRSGPVGGVKPRFHAVIVFRDEAQWNASVQEVQGLGIRSGAHGLMIEKVVDFTTAVSEELAGRSSPD